MKHEIGDYDGARWYHCTAGCGAEYRNEQAARYCCSRKLQAAAIGRRMASRTYE